MRGELRVRLTIAAAAALIACAGLWWLNLRVDQCGNADSVECSPVGYVLLYAWMAAAVLTVVLVATAAFVWLTYGVRRARLRSAR